MSFRIVHESLAAAKAMPGSAFVNTSVPCVNLVMSSSSIETAALFPTGERAAPSRVSLDRAGAGYVTRSSDIGGVTPIRLERAEIGVFTAPKSDRPASSSTRLGRGKTLR